MLSDEPVSAKIAPIAFQCWTPHILQYPQPPSGRQGFDHAAAVYLGMHKESPDFKPDEEAIHSWATQLTSENHLPEATELLKLDVQLYPESGNAYDNPGEAHMKSGQKELAIESYKKSLEKNPDNTNARDTLEQLQGNAATPKD